MLRGAGAFLIIAGCMLYGLLERARLHLRVRQMKLAAEMLRSINSEISYGKASLDIACRETAKRVSAPYNLFLQRVYDENRKNRGQSFYEIWKNGLLEMDKALLLNREEKELLEQFGRCSGSMDMALQEASMERVYQELMQKSRQAECDCENRVKIALSLSAAGGMVLALLLV